MSLTQIAVILAGILFILIGASITVSTTLYLVFGIAIVVLVLIDSPIIRSGVRN